MGEPQPHPQPGWYDDPSSPSMLRWWSGSEWTGDTKPAPTSAPEQAPDPYGPPPADGTAHLQAVPADSGTQPNPQMPFQQGEAVSAQPQVTVHQPAPSEDAEKAKNPLATWSLVLALTGPFTLGPVNYVASIITGSIALGKAGEVGTGKSKAIWGVVLGIIGLILSIIFIAMVAAGEADL